MRKQELIHVHGLLSEVATFCKDGGIIDDMKAYNQLGTRPTSIQQSKGNHKEAVFALTEAINSAIETEPSELATAESVSAD